MHPDGTLVTVVLAIIAGVVAVVRLEGKQYAHERECAQKNARFDERCTNILDAVEEMKETQKEQHAENKREQKERHEENKLAILRLERRIGQSDRRTVN